MYMSAESEWETCMWACCWARRINESCSSRINNRIVMKERETECVCVMDEWERECEKLGGKKEWVREIERDKHSKRQRRERSEGECCGLNLLFLAAEWCSKKVSHWQTPFDRRLCSIPLLTHILTVWVGVRESKWVRGRKSDGALEMWLHRNQQTMHNRAMNLYSLNHNNFTSIHKPQNIYRIKIYTTKLPRYIIIISSLKTMCSNTSPTKNKVLKNKN